MSISAQRALAQQHLARISLGWILVPLCLVGLTAQCAFCQDRSGLPPVNPRNSSNAGRIALDDGRFDDAIMHFNIVLGEQSEDPQAWFLLGQAQHLAGRFPDAIASYREATRFASTRHKALFGTAQVYALLKDETKTLQMLHEAVEAGFRENDFRHSEEFAFVRDTAEFQALANKALPAWERAEYHALDFWRGSWRIVDADSGEDLGLSESETHSDRFLMHESWQAGGNSGRRFCYFEPNSEQWKMLILTPEYRGELIGKIADGTLKCEGKLHNADGMTMPVFVEVSRSGANISFRMQTVGEDGDESRILAAWEYRPALPQNIEDGESGGR